MSPSCLDYSPTGSEKKQFEKDGFLIVKQALSENEVAGLVEMTVEHLYSRLDPIRRQLLGDRISRNGVYDPTEADAPLRSLLAEHSPDDAVWTRHKRSQSRPPAYENRVQLAGRNPASSDTLSETIRD